MTDWGLGRKISKEMARSGFVHPKNRAHHFLLHYLAHKISKTTTTRDAVPSCNLRQVLDLHIFLCFIFYNYFSLSLFQHESAIIREEKEPIHFVHDQKDFLTYLHVYPILQWHPLIETFFSTSHTLTFEYETAYLNQRGRFH